MDVIRAALQTIWRSDRHHEVLKTRLDAVGQPYAIGTRKMTGGCADVLVKTSLSQILSPVCRLSPTCSVTRGTPAIPTTYLFTVLTVTTLSAVSIQICHLLFVL